METINRDLEPVWYACYGSNLSSERFSYYILGGDYKGTLYEGCADRTLWSDSAITSFPGNIYFGNSSHKWHDGGVAFYDPYAEGKVLMRLYKITWGQLKDVQKQEGMGGGWYDDCHYLDEYDYLPVYTLTAKHLPPGNPPHDEYRDLIIRALYEECEMTLDEARRYVEAGNLDLM